MGKRGNGEGSITRRKDGLYMARYTVQTATGPKRKAIYAKTRKEVSEKLAEALANRDKGLLFEAGSLKLGEYLERWLNDSVRGSVKPVTFESYARLVRVHVAPALGRVKLNKLSPAHLQGFYRSKLDAGLSPRTVQYLHVVLHRALKQALRWGLVARNAAVAVDPPKVHRKEVRTLSTGEVKKLLDAARDDRLEALYMLALTTGMRQGEMLGLRWEDVDLESGSLRVQGTKTAGSRRAVKLSQRAKEALRRHLERQLREIDQAGSLWRENGLVFATQSGTHLDRHNLLRQFRRLLKKAGLPDIPFHNLRHTCATILFGRNTHPKLVQALLGHASAKITLDTYSHVIPGMDDGVAEAMDDALS